MAFAWLSASLLTAVYEQDVLSLRGQVFTRRPLHLYSRY